jgi:hypothetical protein
MIESKLAQNMSLFETQNDCFNVSIDSILLSFSHISSLWNYAIVSLMLFQWEIR